MKEKLLLVELSPYPNTNVRDIDYKIDSDKIIQSKKKYPFELLNDVTVTIQTTNFDFSFTIPKKYCWNGADIPKTLFIFGQSKDNNYLHASMVHDYMLEKRDYIYNLVLKRQISVDEYRRLTSLIFREILKIEKTNTIKANIMAWCVDVYQATVQRKEWGKLK